MIGKEICEATHSYVHIYTTGPCCVSLFQPLGSLDDESSTVQADLSTKLVLYYSAKVVFVVYLYEILTFFIESSDCVIELDNFIFYRFS